MSDKEPTKQKIDVEAADKKLLERALQDYQTKFVAVKQLRSEFSNIPGYVRKKSDEELSYHNVKKYFGDFNPSNKKAMEANDNEGKGVVVELADGQNVHIKNQLDLYHKIVAFNKENGSYFDESYIKNKNSHDIDRLNKSQNELNDSKTTVLSFYENKNEGQKALSSIEIEVTNNKSDAKMNKNDEKDFINVKKNTVSLDSVTSDGGFESPPAPSIPPLFKKNKKEMPLGGSLPDHILENYTQKGQNFYYKDTPGKLAFVDKINLLETDHHKSDLVDSMISITKHREWTDIHVTGTDSFRQDVWKKASEQGITVHGYTPSEKEIASLKSKLSEADDVNKKESNSPQPGSLSSNRVQEVASKIDNPEHKKSFIEVASNKLNEQDSANHSTPPLEDKPKDSKKTSMSP